MRILNGRILEYGYADIMVIPALKDPHRDQEHPMNWSKYWVAIYTEMLVVADIGSFRGKMSEVKKVSLAPCIFWDLPKFSPTSKIGVHLLAVFHGASCSTHLRYNGAEAQGEVALGWKFPGNRVPQRQCLVGLPE